MSRATTTTPPSVSSACAGSPDVKKPCRLRAGAPSVPRGIAARSAARSVRQGSVMKLDYHIFKSMANAYFGRYVDRARRPTFFNVKESYPSLDQVTQAYPVIRREFDQLMARSNE